MKYTTFCLFLIILVVESVNITKQEKLKSHINAGRRITGRGEVFENLVQLYDPTFLSLVWPKISNSVHVLLELSCWDDVTVFFKDLRAGRAWAYRALDATGRYPSGVFTDHNVWLGSKTECLQLDHEFTSRENNETLEDLSNNEYVNSMLRRGKYFDNDIHNWRWTMHREELSRRIIAADNRPPYRMAFSMVKMTLNITKITMTKSYDIILGVCLPKSCLVDDVESIMNFGILMNDNLKSNSPPRFIKVDYVRQTDEYNLETDGGAIFLICITILLAILALSAAGVEMNVIKCKKYHKNSMSFDLERINDEITDKEKTMNLDLKCVEDIARTKDLIVTNIKPGTVPTDVNKGNCAKCGKLKKQCEMKRNTSCYKSKYSFESVSTEEDNDSLFVRLYLCFSLIYCWERIFNKTTANQNLSLIHGLRIVATFWIIFVDISAVVYYTSGKIGDIDEHSDIYYTLITGTLAFDTLFFVSGLFSSHHFFYMKSRYSVEELVNFGGACGQILQFVCFVTNRIVRMLPSYIFAIIFSAVLGRVSRNNGAMILPDGDHQNCGIFWWRNLLYITNLYPDEEKCMQVSWFLSTETQLHALGALACTTSVSGNTRARFVSALALLGILASTAVDVSTAYADFESKTFLDIFCAYASIIERPLSRLAPYMIGVFVGWLIHVLDGKLRVTKVTGSIIWILSLTLLFVSCVLPYVTDAWLTAWVHLAWPVALMWPVVICTTKYAGFFHHILGSSNIAGLSRLCYGMLLLHIGVTKGLLLSVDTALSSQFIFICIYFISISVVTVLAALFLSLLVEMPCCSLLRRLSDCASS